MKNKSKVDLINYRLIKKRKRNKSVNIKKNNSIEYGFNSSKIEKKSKEKFYQKRKNLNIRINRKNSSNNKIRYIQESISEKKILNVTNSSLYKHRIYKRNKSLSFGTQKSIKIYENKLNHQDLKNDKSPKDIIKFKKLSENVLLPYNYKKTKLLDNNKKNSKNNESNLNYEINIHNEKEENYDFNIEKKYLDSKSKIINTICSEGKIINIYNNNKKEIIFENGIKKEIFNDGHQIIHFPNGDIKQEYSNGNIVYFFKDSKTVQTTLDNGTQIFKFNNGQIEKHFVEGNKEIKFPDGTKKYIFCNGCEVTYFPDGTTHRMNSNKIISNDRNNNFIKFNTINYKSHNSDLKNDENENNFEDEN